MNILFFQLPEFTVDISLNDAEQRGLYVFSHMQRNSPVLSTLIKPDGSRVTLIYLPDDYAVFENVSIISSERFLDVNFVNITSLEFLNDPKATNLESYYNDLYSYSINMISRLGDVNKITSYLTELIFSLLRLEIEDEHSDPCIMIRLNSLSGVSPLNCLQHHEVIPPNALSRIIFYVGRRINATNYCHAVPFLVGYIK